LAFANLPRLESCEDASVFTTNGQSKLAIRSLRREPRAIGRSNGGSTSSPRPITPGKFSRMQTLSTRSSSDNWTTPAMRDGLIQRALHGPRGSRSRDSFTI
jgi:hypothetical protein